MNEEAAEPEAVSEPAWDPEAERRRAEEEKRREREEEERAEAKRRADAEHRRRSVAAQNFQLELEKQAEEEHQRILAKKKARLREERIAKVSRHDEYCS